MTDEQIIKALECCTIDGEKDCFNCAETNWMSCKTTLMKQALDLINKQKAEIEQLRHRDEEFLLKNYTFDTYYDEHITKAKSEAIKARKNAEDEYFKPIKEEFEQYMAEEDEVNNVT